MVELDAVLAVVVEVAEVAVAVEVAEVEAVLDVEPEVEAVEVEVVRVAWALQQGDKRVYHKSPRL
ncbi:MAG: hypothetical protein HYY46_17210 [Deltaproteobacteria bacterium]|nr:hypothetical protein [Deltaproteobacteria bacterium]